MSKGKIIKHLGNAQYLVDCQLDMTEVNARIKALNKQIEESNIAINTVLEKAVKTAQNELNAINVNTKDAFQLIIDTRKKLDDALAKLTNEKLKRKNSIDEKAKLEQIEGNVEKKLWLADLNTELAPNTEVGIIDFYDMRKNSTSVKQVIIPAYINPLPESAYIPIRDGRLVPNEILSTYSWWYAFCACAGWERYNPRYRKGTITTIHENNKCDVLVDSNYTQVIPHTAKSLNNKEINLKNVPVRYLSCDALAFAVGDRVILEYPLKNIHQTLKTQYEQQKTAIEQSKTALQTKIDKIQTKIDKQQTILDTLQTDIDELNIAIKDESLTNGIDDLQNTINILEAEIEDLKSQIENVHQKKLDYENETNKLQNDILNLQNQLKQSQQELANLITNNASSLDISDKQLEIAQIQGKINTTTTDFNLASANLATKQLEEDNLTQDKLRKMQDLSDKRLELQPLLSKQTINKSALKIKLDDFIAETLRKTAFEEEIFIINLNKSNLDSEIKKRDTLINEEQIRFERLKKYTDTRSQEVTVIGFESNPKPCGISLTVMNVIDNQGTYKTSIDTPYQISDLRYLYTAGTNKALTKGLYAGGGQKRTFNENNVFGRGFSEGGSWRGYLNQYTVAELDALLIDMQSTLNYWIGIEASADKIIELQAEIDNLIIQIQQTKSGKRKRIEVAVSWSYYDNTAIDYPFPSYNNNNYYFDVLKKYTVYIAGRFGELGFFNPDGEGAMMIAGMCLYNIGTSEKYGLAVLYKTGESINQIPYLVTYSIEKSGKDKLSFVLKKSLKLTGLNGNSHNLYQYYNIRPFLRRFTGFTSDGLYIASTYTDGINYYVESIKFDINYNSYESFVVYQHPVTKYQQFFDNSGGSGNNIVAFEALLPYSLMSCFCIFADSDRFVAYIKYIDRNNYNLEDLYNSGILFLNESCIDFIEIPLNGFYSIKQHQLGGNIINQVVYAGISHFCVPTPRFVLFCSVKLDIYLYLRLNYLSVENGVSPEKEFFIELYFGSELQITYKIDNIDNTESLEMSPYKYNYCYSDNLLILSTPEPNIKMKTMIIDVKSKRLVSLTNSINIDTTNNVSPIALIHLPF